MKKILMLLAFAGVASVASAQQTMTVTEYDVIQVQDKYQVLTNPFWSNWFFSVGGGAQMLYGNNDHIGKFRPRGSYIQRLCRQMANSGIRIAYAIQRIASQGVHYERNG